MLSWDFYELHSPNTKRLYIPEKALATDLCLPSLFVFPPSPFRNDSAKHLINTVPMLV